MYPLQNFDDNLKRDENFSGNENKLLFTQRKNYGNFESNLIFLNNLKLFNKDAKILEIGTGRGALLHHLYSQGFNIQGIEINKELIDEAFRLYGKLPIKLMSGDAMEFEDSSFDIVISFDVFEHIKDSDKHLKEIRRVLKPNGYYLLQTPNKWTNTIFETIRWKSFTKWRKDHCSLHNYWQIIERFHKNGFEVEFYKIPVITDFFKLKIKAFLGKIGLMLLKTINPDKFLHPLRTNFYIKAIKTKSGYLDIYIYHIFKLRYLLIVVVYTVLKHGFL